MKKLVFATSNEHKLIEAKSILNKIGYEVISLKEAGITSLDVKETGTTFKDNAIIKARYVYDLVHLPTIADDSGLEISALHNFPGIYSARFLNDLDYHKKNNYLIQMLEDVSNRKARFVCALAYIDEQVEKVFMGYVYGRIAYKIEGENGFGYDPIFYMDKYHTTLGNIPSEEKNKVSHRYNALKKLGAYLKNE